MRRRSGPCISRRCGTGWPTLAATAAEAKAPYPNVWQARAELSAAALVRAAFSRRQVHEMVVELWHDHFNVSGDKDEIGWLLATDDRDVY